MKRESRYNMMMFVIASILCFFIGLMLQYVEAIEGKTLCYILCGAMMGFGVVESSKYFITQSYKSLDDYSFTIGLMMVIIGFIGIIRIEEIVPFLLTILIFPCLAIGMILFQFSIQLKVLKKNYWVGELVICLVVIIASILALLSVSWIKNLPQFINYLLMGSGLAGLISYLIVYLIVKGVNRKERIEHKEHHHKEHHDHDEHHPDLPRIDD